MRRLCAHCQPTAQHIHIRKTEMVLLCQPMQKRSYCHDRTVSGLTTRIKEVAPECETTQWIIHREMQGSRNHRKPLEFNSVFE